MRIPIITLVLLLLFLPLGLRSTSGNNKLTATQYIEKYKDAAIEEMIKYKIPASITLAQGMLESGNGNSFLAVKANNHFGIKCHSNWKGKSVKKDDDKKNECFRKYPSVSDSFEDHSKFLYGKSRYASLFKLKTTDYKGWAKGLKKAGYATNPKYPSLLISIIEKYELYQYDTTKKLKKKKGKKENASATVQKKPTKVSAKPAKKSSRKVYRLGIKKYIIIKQGDTFYSISKQTDKDLWQLYKYNDLTEKDVLTIGEKLFLQPKKNKANIDTHTVKEGETMRFISQLYGIKLKSLYRKNYMNAGEEPKAGEIIYMRKSKPTDSF